MIYSGDREEAKKVVKQMRQDLIGMTQDMHMKMREDPSEIPEISKWIESVQEKVPVIQTLEKKLDIMQGLDPLMDGIIERMNQVTDHHIVRQLQADDKVKKTKQHLEDVLERAHANGLVVHMPMTFDTPKDVKIKNVVASALGKLDPKDHAEAKK